MVRRDKGDQTGMTLQQERLFPERDVVIPLRTVDGYPVAASLPSPHLFRLLNSCSMEAVRVCRGQHRLT
jgi:hypothetical protein